MFLLDSPLLIPVIASFFAGLLGYIIARMWVKPILRYNIVKRKLARNLMRYAARIEPTPSEHRDRQNDPDSLISARRQAMDLVACYSHAIPYWYRLFLDSRRESPAQASGYLTHLSKLKEPERILGRIVKAKKALRLK